MAISKVIYGGQTLIDLTADTVTADQLKKGITAHGADGELITGTCTHDANTQDATATAAEILSGKTAYNKGSKVTGTMPNMGGWNAELDGTGIDVNIPQGYHDGSGCVSISDHEKQMIQPQNIREGITIFGVQGTMTGTEDAKPQQKTVTPSVNAQTVVPDEGYNYLSQVTVAAIPYAETDNSAGGKTVTIG